MTERPPIQLVVELPPEAYDAIAARVAALMAPANEAPEPWVDTAEAARHLACSPGRIHDLKAKGAIPFRKDGSRLLFRRSDLDAYLNAQEAAA